MRDFNRSIRHRSLPFCDFALYIGADKLRLRKLRQGGHIENAVKLGEHLKNRRLILGLTQEQVATQLGVLREVYDRWERNERLPVVSVWPSIIAFIGYYPSQPDASAAGLVLMARRVAGLNQKALAHRLGIIHQKLRDWELGRRLPSKLQLRALETIVDRLSLPTPR